MYKTNKFFGPGVAQILNLVKQKGTLSEAYKIMKISSSKAWKIIKNAESDLGFKLIHTVTGGSSGGNSTLTKEGEDLLNRYTAFTKEIDDYASKLFEKYFNLNN